MSTRERWIVYPLLFLALGAALRDKFVPPSSLRAGKVEAQQMEIEKLRCGQLEVGTVKCNVAEAGRLAAYELDVTDKQGKPRVSMGVVDNQAGQVNVYGPDDRLALVAGADRSGRAGMVQVAAQGDAQVLLHSVNGWGRVTTLGPGRSAACTMGGSDLGIGLFAEYRQSGHVLPLTRVAPASAVPTKVPKSSPEEGPEKP